MSNASQFVRLNSGQSLVSVMFDGTQYRLPSGMNLAAAFLSAGITDIRRTPVSGAVRGPYCMMGACYDCLVEIDGENRQACMITVRKGLIVNRVAYLDNQVK